MNCLVEAVASVWVSGLRLFNRKAVEQDLANSAREQLEEALKKVAAQQSILGTQLTSVANEVRTRRDVLSKQELKKLLLRSRRIKLDQRSLDDKTRVMEGQLNALESNEFNKVVLSTLQTSAKAMQKMGLGKDLQRTDQVISELEEGMQFSSDMTQALATNIGGEVPLDEAELDAELGEILGLDTPECVFGPKTVTSAPVQQPNSMGLIEAEPATLQPVADRVEEPHEEGVAGA